MENKKVSPKEVMLQMFNLAKLLDATHIGVDVEIDNNVNPEMIINCNADFDAKRDYYDSAYDDNLMHKYANNVRISNIAYGGSAIEVITRLERDRDLVDWRRSKDE